MAFLNTFSMHDGQSEAYAVLESRATLSRLRGLVREAWIAMKRIKSADERSNGTLLCPIKGIVSKDRRATTFNTAPPTHLAVKPCQVGCDIA